MLTNQQATTRMELVAVQQAQTTNLKNQFFFGTNHILTQK